MKMRKTKMARPGDKDGGDPPINMGDLIIPQNEVNTCEGCEYLDDHLSREEHPASDIEEQG